MSRGTLRPHHQAVRWDAFHREATAEPSTVVGVGDNGAVGGSDREHERGIGMRAAPAAVALLVLLTGCTGAPALSPEERRSLHPTPTTPIQTPVAPQHLVGRPYVKNGHEAQVLDLTVPGGHVGPRPVVVFIHGGAWASGSRSMWESSEGANFAALRARLLERGWATVSVDYRLTDTARMPAQLHDVKAAVRWVHAHAGRYGLDRDRIAVIGDSAGGHLAQLLGTTRGRPEFEGELGTKNGARSDVVAVVSYYGVTDLRRLVADRVAAGCGRGDAGRTSPEGRLLGVEPAARSSAAKANAASPIGHVTPQAAPTLMFHGKQDCVVPAAQSERMAGELDAAGVPTELVLVEGARHADPVFFTRPDMQQQALDFLARHLGE